jgi:peptidyl-prolyl cis-trans isomerase C
MKLKSIPLIFVSSTLLIACQPKVTVNPSNITKDEAAAVVNGKFISKTDLKILTEEVAERSQGRIILKKQLIDELIKRELLIQDAKNKHLDQSPEILKRLAMMQNSLLSQAAVEDYIKANPVTDAELQAEYTKQISNGEGIEFKARHILVKTEDEAKAVITKLDQGSDFIALAKTESTGPSKTQGGDLGWFIAKQMVPEFSAAVADLKNKAYTKTAVKTQFGWHVILREDSRKKTPPPFAAVQAQLKPLVQREKLISYLDALRSGAQVEILVPLTDEKTPTSATPPVHSHTDGSHTHEPTVKNTEAVVK